ncbi:MAG TPA: PP2C family protein-serine/threonine phosphatase [Vicinamibacteria bacterium]
MSRQWSRESRQFWASLPRPARLLFQAAVFCTFSSLGFAVDLTSGGRYSGPGLLLSVVSCGLIALGWVKGVQDWRYLPLPIGLQAASVLVLPRIAPLAHEPLDAAALAARAQLDGAGLVLLVMAGYSLFVAFIGRQGTRQLRLHTELELARQIHEALVPPLHQHWEGYEVYGRALPASEVGGDLLDAVAGPGTLTCLVADVTGHGVPAGTFMGMVKSAARMRLRSGGALDEVARDLNEVLLPLKRPSMFATCAFVRLEPGGTARYLRAGHPPLLHFVRATGQTARYQEGGLPLGVLRGEAFTEHGFSLAPGDVLALITDGLTEVTDRAGRELGLEGLERALAAGAGHPLPALFEAILAAVRTHGPQQDDQTLLLVRVH